MKVCFLIPSLVAGGAERVVSHMANYWCKLYDVTIITFNCSNQEPFYKIRPQVRLIQLDLMPKGNLINKIISSCRQILVVRRQINILKPDVLIAFLDIAIFVSILATLFLPVKVIVSERNNPYKNSTNPVRQWLNNKLYSLSDRLVLQTREITTTFPAKLHSKIRVISNPILTPSWRVTDYENQHASKVIIAIGRLFPQKGFDILIIAFAKLVSDHPHWKLYIIGSGEELIALQQLSENLAVSDRVVFLGQVKDTNLILRNSSFFVLSSRFEGFPNALCEAMSVGMPVIATRCKFGPEEIIQHRKNGLLVPVEDNEAMAKALELLANDPELCRYLGTNAAKISNTLHINKVMQQWEDVINPL